MRNLTWLAPTLGYVLLLGFFGVTAKLAMRTLNWEQVLFWLPFAYLAWIVGFAVTRGTRFPWGAGGAWAALAAVLGASAVVLLFIALGRGDASRVIPVSSAYPVVAVIASYLFLSEGLSVARVFGTALVVVGLIMLGFES